MITEAKLFGILKCDPHDDEKEIVDIFEEFVIEAENRLSKEDMNIEDFIEMANETGCETLVVNSTLLARLGYTNENLSEQIIEFVDSTNVAELLLARLMDAIKSEVYTFFSPRTLFH